MKLKILLAGLAILLTATTLPAQITGDVMGVHNLGPGSKSPIVGSRPDSCSYCHAPHSGLNRGLWNQKLTKQTYTIYKSTTEVNKGQQPTLGSDSNQCLSCHDGTVAVGETVAYGQVNMSGHMDTWDVFTSNMQSSHPFSLTTKLKDKVDLVASLVASGKTGDTTGAVKLINGNVECTSCHDPHVQAKDLVSLNFLAKDSSSGQMCLACHDPTRVMGATVNQLADWPTSAHALSTDQIATSASLGSYKTVAADACISCHAPHNANGPSHLLRGPSQQDCIACHNGANISPMNSWANVFPEYAKEYGHPFPTSPNPHRAAESTLLNNNRHATCVDCHNAHGSQMVGTFSPPPLIRISQKNIAGINASDGVSELTPAINQYENCLRCHGTSTGKQTLATYKYIPVRAVSAGDTLNLIPQFTTTTTSSHPVMHGRISAQSQPSLRLLMLNLDGSEGKRSVGSQILCTDCHNSDDNREFGGLGPNGPHGSAFPHILERRYEFSQAPSPGQPITNLFPSPDLSTSAGPYALCSKCHDLSTVETVGSWSGHSKHIEDGFSCSTCHTAHGNGAVSGTITGQRLINFDVNVVAPVVVTGGTVLPISYTYGPNTCVLVCHGATHNPDGTVSLVRVGRGLAVKR